MASDFAGFPAANIAAYFGVSPTVAQAIIDMGAGQPLSPAAQQSLQSIGSRLAPGGDISGGLQHLQEHPMGSHYHGDVNVTDLAANFATGGLYGVGKAALNTLDTGKIGPGLSDALASYGTFGSLAQPTLGTKNTLMADALIGGGALGASGLGGGAAAGGAGEAGAATPYYAGANDFMVNVPGGGVGAFAPGAEGAVHMFNPALGGFAGAGVGGAGSGSSVLGAGSGALTGLQAAQMFLGGASPLSMPAMGAPQAGVQGGGTAAMNPALAGASQNDPHLGLAPRFEARQRGSREAPGLSTMPLVSEYYQQR